MSVRDQLRYLQQQLNDIDKQLRAQQRLEVSPTVNVVSYSGTPVAGQVAQWTGAGTITQSGYAGSAVARYSGAPTAGQLAYWTAAGTVTGGTAVPDAYIQALGDARYLPVNGSTPDSGIQHYSADIGDIATTQVLTIDLVLASVRRTWITYVDFTGNSGASNGFWAYASAKIIWQQGNGTITIRDVTWSRGASGTEAHTVTTITNGIRVTIASSGFGGTLNQNHLVVRIIGTSAASVSITTAIT